MLTLNHRLSLGAKVARTAALCLLALGAALFPSREARAQWTTPDTAGNINNTNTGNVGVGTTAPAAKLHTTTGTASRNTTLMIVPDGSGQYYAPNNHDARS